MNLEEKIAITGFSCQCCGECCSGADNEVMVSPDEIDILMKATGLSFEEIVEPYPEWFEDKGMQFTFGWVLRRGKDGNCMFLKDKRCSVYKDRPQICRTYPFMLDGNQLITSECSGYFTGRKCTEAAEIAQNLHERRDAEDKEYNGTKLQYQKHCNNSSSILVFDSRGAHPWKIE